MKKMEWTKNGYTIIEKGNGTKGFYYTVVIDGEDVADFLPYSGLKKTDFRAYLSQNDLVGTIDYHERRFWLPLYMIKKVDIQNKWAEDENLFSSYSKRESELKFSELSAPNGFEIRLVYLEKPDNFDNEDEVNYDVYTTIDVKVSIM